MTANNMRYFYKYILPVMIKNIFPDNMELELLT